MGVTYVSVTNVHPSMCMMHCEYGFEVTNMAVTSANAKRSQRAAL